MKKSIKALGGDGLLSYALIKIFSNYSIKNYLLYIQKLGENKVLGEIVLKNPLIFNLDKDCTYYGNSHTLGTIFEAYIYDYCESEGLSKMVTFIKKAYEPVLKNGHSDPCETYHQWIHIHNARLGAYIASKEYALQ